MTKSEKEEIVQEISARESGKLLGFLRKWVPGLEDARDLMQDVFYHLILGVDEIRDIEKATSWLYRTARNKAIDFLRKKKPVTESSLSRNEDESVDLMRWVSNWDIPHQELALWQEEVWGTIQEVLESIPTDQRNAFVWHELEGISMSEISEREKVPINTIISRKRYAVMTLKKRLNLLYNELNT